MEIISSFDMFQEMVSGLIKEKIDSEVSERDTKIDKVELALSKSRETVDKLNKEIIKMKRDHKASINKLLKEQNELKDKTSVVKMEEFASAARKEGTNSGLDLAYFLSDLAMGRSLTPKKVTQIVSARSRLWFKMLDSTEAKPLVLFPEDICTDIPTLDSIKDRYHIKVSRTPRGK